MGNGESPPQLEELDTDATLISWDYVETSDP